MLIFREVNQNRKSYGNDKKTSTEWKELWFVTKSNNSVINISKNRAEANFFLRNSLKNEGAVHHAIVPQEDWDLEKVTCSTIENYV